MRVFITGGNGRLGSWVGRDLRDHGHEIVSVDRQLPQSREDGITYRAVELSDLGQVIGAMAGCEAVLHFGAIPAPWSHPDEVVFGNNVTATYNALQAAMTVGTGRAIIASSASAYGMAWARPTIPPRYVPLDEAHPFLAHDPYALSKEVDERTAEMFVRRCGMTVLAYRFHWISRPGEAKARGEAQTPPSYKDSTNLWGYVDIRDAAQACRLGLESDLTGFHPFNIIAADTLRHEPTEELLRDYLPTTEVRAPLLGNASAWSSEKARKLLGYVPQHSWRDE